MKISSGIALMMCFLFLYFAGIPIMKKAPSEQSDQIDKYIEEQMHNLQISGLSLAVVKDGESIKTRGYGFANIELQVPASEASIYQIASVTKQFTATAVMILVEEHKIGLDDKITQYLSNLPLDWQSITIRHLLTHTSGIVSYTSLPEWDRNLYPISKEEIMKLVAKYPLNFQPGNAWDYNNTGYFLLGMIIEKVSGQSYSGFLKERIFTPLNMKDTRVNDLNSLIKNRTSGYERTSRLINARDSDPSWGYAAGALISTVTDLTKWDAALYTEKILKRHSLEQMWTPVILNNGETFPYGFGWAINKINGHRVIWHNGGIQGFCSSILRFPDDQVTVIVLINQTPLPVDQIALKVASFSIKGLLPPGYEVNNDHNLSLFINEFVRK